MQRLFRHMTALYTCAHAHVLVWTMLPYIQHPGTFTDQALTALTCAATKSIVHTAIPGLL